MEAFKDWLVPSLSFIVFVYFMVFVVAYAIKIGGPNVPFYSEAPIFSAPKSEEERFLQDISKEIRKNF